MTVSAGTRITENQNRTLDQFELRKDAPINRAIMREGKTIPAGNGSICLSRNCMPRNIQGALTFSLGAPENSGGESRGASSREEAKKKSPKTVRAAMASLVVRFGTVFTLSILFNVWLYQFLTTLNPTVPK
jgi:hypothetical protein